MKKSERITINFYRTNYPIARLLDDEEVLQYAEDVERTYHSTVDEYNHQNVEA